MNDLTSQITQILSNPEMMEQIRSLSGLFGQSADVAEQPQSRPTQSAIPQSKPAQQMMSDYMGADGIQAVMKLMPIFNELKQEDDTTRLLRAIKPFLSDERQAKLEEAIKLLRVIRILPLLKNQGIMNLF